MPCSLSLLTAQSTIQYGSAISHKTEFRLSSLTPRTQLTTFPLSARSFFPPLDGSLASLSKFKIWLPLFSLTYQMIPFQYPFRSRYIFLINENSKLPYNVPNFLPRTCVVFYNKILIFILKIICAKRKHLALFYLLQKRDHVMDIFFTRNGQLSSLPSGLERKTASP